MPTTNLQLPHLVSFSECFELRTNRHCRAVSAASKKWALESNFLDEDERRNIHGLQAGLLASLAYPTCDVAQLLLISQFLIILVHWTDKSPMLAAAIFDLIWSRLLRTSSVEWQARFRRHLSGFRAAQALVERDNSQAVIPDLESFIALRQESSGAKMLFDLIEYAEDLRISDEIYAEPVLRQLRHNACNIISWSYDIAAFAHKYATNDQHNIVTVLMAERCLPMQGAVQAAGYLVKETVGNFLANERMLLSEASGECVDADVRRYVRGLRDVIVGCTHWLYETDRFFGDSGDDVRDLGWVFLSTR